MPNLYNIQQEIFNYLYRKPVDASILTPKAQDELSIYQSLILNGAEALLENIYPFCYKLLADNWEAIIELYHQHYPSTSAIYNQQAKFFPEFLASEIFKQHFSYPNYLAELALYEWTELEVHNALDIQPESGKLTPIHRILELQYPITQVIEYLKSDSDSLEEMRSTDVEEEAEIVFLYRDHKSCKARFFKLSVNTLFVIQALKQEQSPESIQADFNHKFNQNVSINEIKSLVQQLINLGILLE